MQVRGVKFPLTNSACPERGQQLSTES